MARFGAWFSPFRSHRFWALTPDGSAWSFGDLASPIMTFTKCKHCAGRVVPMADGRCPSCQRALEDSPELVESAAPQPPSPSPSQSSSQPSRPAPVCLDPRERIRGHWVAQSGDSHLFVRGGAMLIITRKARQECSWQAPECDPSDGSVTLRVSVPNGATHSCRMSFTPDGKLAMSGQSMVGETTSVFRY